MADFAGFFSRFVNKNTSNNFVAAGLISVVMMLIIPLPVFLLDLFMILNLLLGVLIILIVLYTKKVLDFSSFPTLLLITTIFGLALNVSSTRRILNDGADFNGAVVRAFSTFVVGSEGTAGIVVGTIFFIILIAVQFMVITKGATRISEVAARFTLDAMPQKQMAIETGLSSGLLTEEEAIQQKLELQMEAGFYGAMDGASKFVSGNIKVGLLITFINVLGGFIVGMAIHGETLEVAAATYISLAIGDGLVSQIPSLLISTATGLIVTRAVSFETIGQDIVNQFGRQANIYYVGGGALVILGFAPGMPTWLLWPLGGLTLYLAYYLNRRTRRKAEVQAGEVAKAESKEAPKEVSPIVPLDPLSLELGYGLIPLVDKEQGAELLERVTRIRREAALDLGLVVPKIRIIDNMRLDPTTYALKIKGTEVGSGSIRMGHYMAINPTGIKTEVPGEQTVDPAFGLPALWISEENRDTAERAGFTVVDAPSIVATHLTEVIKKHAAEILGRQEVQSILSTLKGDYPAVVEEVNKQFGTGEIQKVLQGLLLEQVSIRNMVVILETLADYGSVTKDVSFLIEKVRQALGRQICMQYADDDKVIRVITLEPNLEQIIIESRDEGTRGLSAALDPDTHRAFLRSLNQTFKKVKNLGYFPVVISSEAARPLIKSVTERDIPDLVVISVLEVVGGFRVESLGEIRLESEE